MTKQLKFHFLAYLAGLSIIGFLATDMYLPTFEAIRTDLQTTKVNIGISMTIFLGGFAFGQLFWGPISDKFGKPKAITFGMLLFIASSIGIAFSYNVYLFIFLQK